MVSFLKKRLQVFVSSTFLDLKKERQAAVSAILNSGHIPAGMELFTAGDQSQMDVIKQWIDESDVYFLILGSRYGSIEPETGKSYTHLEYEYAVSIDKPLFACVIEEGAVNSRLAELGKDCLELENPGKLKEFRKIVVSKMSGFWSDTKDIELETMKALQTFSRKEDLIGWVKGNEAVDTVALTDELARLSKENADLREENNQLRLKTNTVPSVASLGIPHEEMRSLLKQMLIDFEIVKTFFKQQYSIDVDIKINDLFDFLLFIKPIIASKDLNFFVVKREYQKALGGDWETEESKVIRSYLFLLCEKHILDLDKIAEENGAEEKLHFYLTDSGYKFINWIDSQ